MHCMMYALSSPCIFCLTAWLMHPPRSGPGLPRAADRQYITRGAGRGLLGMCKNNVAVAERDGVGDQRREQCIGLVRREVLRTCELL